MSHALSPSVPARRIILIAALAALLGPSLACDWVVADADPIPDPLSNRLEATLDSMVAVLGVPGAAAWVEADDGTRVLLAAGVMEGSEPAAGSGWHGVAIDPTAHTRIGSLTKSFTAALVLLLAQEGRLDLDSTIAAYLPDTALPNGNRVTLRHLLSMRSGLPEYMAHDAFQRQWPPPVWTLEDLIDLAVEVGGPVFEPGEAWMYSNTNYVVLGRIAEAVTGRSYAELVTSRILEPAGLRETTVPEPGDASLPTPHLNGYAPPGSVAEGWVDVTAVPPAYAGSAGNMVSTLRDLAGWIRVLRGDELLSTESRAALWEAQPTGVPGLRYGFGVAESPVGFGHNGSLVGFQTALYEWRGWVIAVMVNGNTRLDDDHGHTADEIVAALEATIEGG